ncbi:hypothetical protein RHSIM_Rhsim08G0164900 [Rhododendron simsii]|uniref:Uncharacterized protein n=1 Tax=Rhododendron simsii TaxID=118357 RepID=A0A834LH43_RHOSS|nr:hypothetical protein RHSIM_Rhsim08G0164900 [Rhododendron simsii]
MGASVEGFSTSKYQDMMRDEPALLHLGGDSFCFLTLEERDPDPDPDPDPVLPGLGRTRTRIIKFRDPNLPGGGRTKIRFSKFRDEREGDFKASVVCRGAYFVDHLLDTGDAFVL